MYTAAVGPRRSLTEQRPFVPGDMVRSNSEGSSSKARGNSRRRDASSSSPMRDEDIEFLQDDRRFLDMTMGEPYEGKYRFADIQQGERVMEKLIARRRRMNREEREYEEELKDVEEIEKITKRGYGKLMVQLKAKEDVLADTRRHADRIKRDYAACRRLTREYSDAIRQARRGLDAMQEAAHQSARGNKRSSDEMEVADPRQGSDREIEPCDPPGIVLRRAPTRIGSEEVREAMRRQAAGDQKGEYRRYAREDYRV